MSNLYNDNTFTNLVAKNDVNVGQFGWSADDLETVNQMNQYLQQMIDMANSLNQKYGEVVAIKNIIDTIRDDAEDLANTIAGLTADFNLKYEEFISKYSDVPRTLSFYHINDFDYESATTIAFYVADKPFRFAKDFVGSVGKFKLKPAFPQLPSAGLIAIYVNATRIGTIQLNLNGTVSFISFNNSYVVNVGDIIDFKVDTLEGVNSFSISLVHEV